MTAYDITAHKRLYTTRHIIIEDMQHAFCKLNLFILSENRTFLRTHILIARIDTIITTPCVRHLLTHLPMQTLLPQRTLFCKTNGITANSFLFEYFLFSHHHQFLFMFFSPLSLKVAVTPMKTRFVMREWCF
jgi:hypothetical protein